MIDDVHLNKSAIIRRCLKRVREEYRDTPERLDDHTVQDAIVLNILRACEAAIDLAMHLVAVRKLGIPQSSRNAFELLEIAGALSAESTRSMMRMCGFRNIAVHNYQEIELAILRSILESHLADFDKFLGELDAE